MALDFFDADLHQIRRGDFPLTHDCILQVQYHEGCGLRYQFFTCRSQDSGTIANLLKTLVVVRKIIVKSVDNFNHSSL